MQSFVFFASTSKATLLIKGLGPIPIVHSILVFAYISRLNFNANSYGSLANK
ncbi:hypothetical protein B4082_2365 [Bacillus cereus]|uniref:Uncharacterized protein n=1 Tax=Bacillus cereus TaxID=1396 RepID=A0A162N322_BACCE|nr:hypothetical protein B4082_2365 [Bacillus cereus]